MSQRSHPSGTDQPSTTQLVQAFFTEAGEAFRPLVSRPGSRWTTQLRHATQNGFELTTTDRIEGIFSADCEFQTAELIGEITFGDREYFINTVVSPRGRTHRYGLWEWADALDRPDLVPRATDFVLQLDRLHEIVRGMADGLLELVPGIARAERQTLQRIEAARAEVQAAHNERLREADHRGAVARANEAFRQQQWDHVIELLESVEDRLSLAESEKLAYARRRV
jgi:hypothetical protein